MRGVPLALINSIFTFGMNSKVTPEICYELESNARNNHLRMMIIDVRHPQNKKQLFWKYMKNRNPSNLRVVTSKSL